jgi:hypothetical protein
MRPAALIRAFPSILALLAGASRLTGADPPPSTAVDDRVATLLTTAALAYEIDTEGDFRLLFKISEGRTQTVYIGSRTVDLGSLELREVWSPGWLSATPLTPAQQAGLLARNAEVAAGAWQLRRRGEEYVAIFSCRLPTGADPLDLRVILDHVAATADRLEAELSGTDSL